MLAIPAHSCRARANRACPWAPKAPRLNLVGPFQADLPASSSKRRSKGARSRGLAFELQATACAAPRAAVGSRRANPGCTAGRLRQLWLGQRLAGRRARKKKTPASKRPRRKRWGRSRCWFLDRCALGRVAMRDCSESDPSGRQAPRTASPRSADIPLWVRDGHAHRFTPGREPCRAGDPRCARHRPAGRCGRTRW